MKHAVLLSGSREWRDRAVVERVLAAVPRGATFIHGNAPGVDRIAASILRKRCFEIAVPYPEHVEGKSGGHIRNALMVRVLEGFRLLGWSTSVFAFPVPTSRSKGAGTYGLVRLATKAEFAVEVMEGA